MREHSFSQSELARALLARVKGSTLFPIETLTKVSFRFVVVVVNVVFLLFSFFFVVGIVQIVFQLSLPLEGGAYKRGIGS